MEVCSVVNIEKRKKVLLSNILEKTGLGSLFVFVGLGFFFCFVFPEGAV